MLRNSGRPGALLALGALVLLSFHGLGAAPCDAELVPLREPVFLPIEGPQGIAVDATDESLWVSFALSRRILHLSSALGTPGLEVIGAIDVPFADPARNEVGGVAYNARRDSLLVSQPVRREIWEIAKDGTALGVVALDLPRPVNIIPEPFLKGIAHDPAGNGGAGSAWIVESVMTRIYEVSMEGEILASFCHPDDVDGCPGEGSAAGSSDIKLHREGGSLAGLEILGGGSRRDRLHRLTLAGERTGLSLPLAEAGGTIGGFARGRARSAGSGAVLDALFVTVESSAELHVFEVIEPGILPLLALECAAREDEERRASVEISWQSTDAYDAIEVLRDGALLAGLAGSAQSFADTAPPEGLSAYEVVARRGACETRASCETLAGAGRILASTPLETKAFDIAEDNLGFLWITDSEKEILVYDKDLELVIAIPGPFQGEEDEPTAIAYNPAGDTFFVYNAKTNEVAEIDPSGSLIGAPFPSGVPSDPEDEALVGSMLYDPAGNGGGGSFWYLDHTRGALEERTRGGVLLRSCVHPDHLAEPPPEAAPLDTFAWGMTAVPGRGFEVLEVGGGKVRDRRSTRFLRLDTTTCAATGFEIPVNDIITVANSAVFGIQRSVHDGREVLYVVSSHAGVRHLLEVEVRPPALPHPTELACRQESAARDVVLSFRPHGDPDAIEVRRNGILIATLPGDAARYDDAGVPEGFHTYSVRSLKGGLASDDRSSSLQVGRGSIARRAFSFPIAAIHQVAYDPAAGLYVTASLANRYSDLLHLYTRDLDYAGEVPSPFVLPRQVAALAVRVRGGGAAASEIHVLGWAPGAAPGTQLELPLRVIDYSGHTLRSFTVRPPRPRGSFVVFPSGMAWDSGTDTLWYLERNSETIVNMTLEGATIASFPHPARLHQDRVINYGLAVDGARGVLYLSSAGRFEHEITKVVELTRSGRLTGFEVPVGSRYYDRVRGFALDPDGVGLLAASAWGEVADLTLYRAFDPLPPVADLACAPEGTSVRLAWTSAAAYEAVAVERDGEEAALLAGGEESWLDLGAPPGLHVYRVTARAAGLESAASVCEAAPDRGFLRGDVEENDVLNITDGVAILGHLFLGSLDLTCPDAADVNDSGDLNITDALAVLNYLFLSGAPPAAPYPLEGLDPTPDALPCPAAAP